MEGLGPGELKGVKINIIFLKITYILWNFNFQQSFEKCNLIWLLQ